MGLYWAIPVHSLSLICIVTANLNPSNKIYKLVKYKSNIQNRQNLKAEATRNLKYYKSASKIEFLNEHSTYDWIVSFLNDTY